MHQSPSDIEMDISGLKRHFAINIEYHQLDFSSISGPAHTSVTLAINLDITVKADRFIGTIHPSSINLLNNLDIAIKAERFIRTTHLPHINLLNNLDIDIKAERLVHQDLSSILHLHHQGHQLASSIRRSSADFEEVIVKFHQ